MFRSQQDKKRQSGYTLIELLVVIACVSILAAIAIPQFVEYKERAYDTESRATLRNLLLACRIYWEDNGSSNSCSVSVASSAKYGFVLPTDVSMGGAGDETSFSATAKHDESINTYSIDHKGAIN